jgi:uncharacterized protein (DUF1015 family)
MATLYPFQGYRYSKAKVPQVAEVVTQPYDKIPEDLRLQYLERHPKNIVRVIKNRDYQNASGYLRAWIEEGTLARDPEPSFYVYRQEFEFEGEALARIGFIGLVSLEDEDLAVKGHENVLKGPLQDRLDLIRETESNEGLIFTLYSDPRMEVDRILEEVSLGGSDCTEVLDDFGVRNQLWRVSDPAVLQKLIAALKGKALFIADGHHRFQTSVLYHQECLEKGWVPRAAESFDKRMIAVFNMDNPDLKILATHRAVRNLEGFSPQSLMERIDGAFELTDLSGDEELGVFLGQEGHRIGLVLGGQEGCIGLTLKRGSLEDPNFMAAVKGPARELDVNILHQGILDPMLGIGVKELASQKHVDYFREREPMLSGIRGGKYQLGFFLKPTSVEQVRMISELGEKMPQKSTDFFPKLLTGLVLLKMEIEKN